MSVQKKSIVLFMGPPGAGKGSISQLCVDRLGWMQVSLGNLCRLRAAGNSEECKQIAFFIKSGKLVPDDLILSTVRSWLEEHVHLFTVLIFDGFPRTLVQAESFQKLLQDVAQLASIKLELVLLDISDEKVVQRLMSRMICSNKSCGATYSTIEQSLKPEADGVCDRCGSALMVRADDTMEAIFERLRIYHEHVEKMVAFYQKQGVAIHKVNVDRPLEDIFDEIKQGLEV